MKFSSLSKNILCLNKDEDEEASEVEDEVEEESSGRRWSDEE